MKLGTTKSKILNAILMAERLTGKKESLPVLSCVLLDASKDLTIRATNLEAGIQLTVPTEIEERGVVAVPAGVFAQTLRAIPTDTVNLSTEDGNLIVESKRTRTLIKAVPHEEFPALPVGQDKKGLSVSREDLMRAISAVLYAASPSMIRPELGSVSIAISSEGMLCVATDSFRLAEKRLSAAQKGEAELLVPQKHAQELLHVLERVEDDVVELSFGDAQMSVEAGSVRYLSRLVDGQFPNYKDLIPKKFETEATLLKGEFADMLRKARVFSGNDQHVGLHIYPKRKLFSATARSNDVGEMSDTLDAALSGDDLDINFHIGYLADCLGSIASDSITLGFAGPARPLVIRGASDPSFTYLVMPLNR